MVLGEKIRVLVVEDSLVFRGILVKYLNESPDIEVIAVAGDPFEARDLIIKHKPDVMTLDIELPRMTGLEFLRKLMPQYPIRTVVISSLNDRVFEALKAGAVDFVAKPVATDRKQVEEFVKRELPDKIKIASKARLRAGYGKATEAPVVKAKMPDSEEREYPRRRLAESAEKAAEVREKAGNHLSKEIDINDGLLVAIGASTGGTEATTAVLERFGPDVPGVVITQHMPEGFTKMYADRLNQIMSVSVKEAENGDKILPGHVYIAPGGDRHMEVIKKGGQYYIQLREADKVNGHRPSVEVLFNSVAKAAGDKAVGVILTGMGGDGAQGLLAMRNAGARTIGQDESTCVVYGMPKVAYQVGAVEFQEKLLDIPQRTYYLVDQIIKNKKL